MQILVVGAGFVGVTTAVAFAERGHAVTLVEAMPERRAALAAGRVPFHEPGVLEAYAALHAAGAIAVKARPEEAPAPEVAFLCVGTPPRADGSADLAQLGQAARDVARATAGWGAPPTVVVKSTVPPGSTRAVVYPVLAELGQAGTAFGLASNPEFLKEGSALADARAPDRIVVGPFDPRAAATMRALYAGFDCPYVETGPETAEAVKYVANAALATRIAFANEVGNLCERLGIDVDEVMRGVGLDARIGPHFLRAGLGFGGSCFPKDVAGFLALGRSHGVPLGILEATLANNATQPLRAVELLEGTIGPLRGRRVAVLGLAFKPNTSDVRETRALPIVEKLVEAGATVVGHDPVAMDEFRRAAGGLLTLAATPEDALRGADAAILVTEWPEYRAIPPASFRTLMRRAVVVDGRRALDRRALREAGVEVRSVGIGDPGAKR